MKIEITSTEKITHMDGVPVRVWEGVTERGIRCFVMVHRLAVNKAEDCEQFDRELKETTSPGQVFDLRQVL